MSRSIDVPRAIAAEVLGTALLLATVVGSGIMGERLAAGNTAMALLANTLATGAMLLVLIAVLGPLSGAHFNPIVSLSAASTGDMLPGLAAAYLLAQVAGALVGVVVAHAMFGEPLIAASEHARSGFGQWLSEGVATFGLIVSITTAARRSSTLLPVIVAAYVTAGYWFTASTCFANPAVTVARSMTNTFAGIRPSDAPSFIVAQVCGGTLATVLCAWLVPRAEGSR